MPAGCKIVHFTGDNGGSGDITYNSDGTLKTVAQGSLVSTYAYSGNTYTVTVTMNGNFFLQSTVTFNADSLATNVRSSYLQNGTNWQNSAFEYNGTQLSKETLTKQSGGPAVVTTFQWTGGNLTQQDVDGDITTYTYYTNQPNEDGDFFWEEMLFAGAQIIRNKNLLKSESHYGDDSNITYTFDTDGKITSWTRDDGTNTYTTTYQYQCN